MDCCPRYLVAAQEDSRNQRSSTETESASFASKRTKILQDSERQLMKIRWDEKAGLRTGCGVRSQVIDVLKAQEIKETGSEEG